MKTTVAVYQPELFPPPHYFNRLLHSDVWVALDDVQINRKAGHTSFRYVDDTGQERKYSIPASGGNRAMLNEAMVHLTREELNALLKTLSHVYRDAPYLSPLLDITERFFEVYMPPYQENPVAVSDMAIHWTVAMLQYLGWKGTFVKASETRTKDLPKHERMAVLTKMYGDVYVCGAEGFHNYLQLEEFEKRGLDVWVQNWTPPMEMVTMLKGPNLSLFEVLAWHGEKTADYCTLGGTDAWQKHEVKEMDVWDAY